MRFYEPGILTIVNGRMGAGKTDWSLKMCERAMDRSPGITIISNIGMTRPVKNYIFANTLTDLLKAMIEVEHGLLVLDEAGIFGSSGSSGLKRETGQWEQFVKLSRKFGLATIWIDQRVKGSVLPTIRDLATWRFHKESKFLVEVFEHGDDRDEWILLERIRLTPDDRTKLPFDTLDIGSFEMDLPVISQNGKDYQLTIRDVFNFLSKFRSHEVRSALKGWLEKIETNIDNDGLGQERDSIERPLKKRDLIFGILDIHQPENMRDFPKNRDLIEMLGSTDQYVRTIKKEWLAKMDVINSKES